MLKNKFLIYCLQLVMLSNVLQAQTQTDASGQSAAGLLFKSYEYPHHERTQFEISHLGDLKAEETQKISFELSFWGADKFGYIFRAITNDGEKLDLVYLPEDISLNLVINEKEVLSKINLESTEVIRNLWHLVSIEFNNRIQISINSQKNVANKRLHLTKIAFGLNYSPENLTIDVPSIALRQLRYFENENLKHWWPLDEWEGDVAKDAIGNQTGAVRNAIWLANQNFNWEFRFNVQTDKIPAITFDSDLQLLHILTAKTHKEIDLTTGVQSQNDYDEALKLIDPVKYGKFNKFNRQHYVYDLRPDNTAILKENQSVWEYNHPPDTSKQLYWQHTSLINPIDSSLYIFGGYGYFLAKNHLLKYDNTLGSWHAVKLTGDVPDPRYHLASGAGPQPGQYYIFGGIGNASGRQELGLKNYYDLFLLDFNNFTIKKITELDNPKNHFVPVNGLVYDQSDSVLFMLGYRNYDPGNNALALLKLSINDNTIQVFSDSIPYQADKTDYADAYLFKGKTSDELIAVTRLSNDEVNAKVNVYSLFYPPIKPLHTKSLPPFVLNKWYFVAIVLPIIVLLSVLFRRKLRSIINPQPKSANEFQPNAKGIEYDTSIYLFGGFMVKNGQGQEVSKLFSPKLRELFILLLLFSQKNRGGIVTKRLTETLWPSMSASNAKNARGVTIQRLRKVLDQLSGLTIAFENERWKLKLADSVYCDYLEFTGIKSQLANGNININTFLTPLKGGDVLPNIQTDWLDKEKFRITDDIINALLEFDTVTKTKLSPRQNVQLADAIFQFDDVNEKALKIKVVSLCALGKNGLANDVYVEFCHRYKNLLGEDFSLSFNDISQ